jgi:hypothetical protein
MTLRLIQAPVNRIMRNPNFPSAFSAPNFERGDIKLNSVKLLEDPENNRKLVLVGTLNVSNTLAERTRHLIEQAKPDAVLVQTNANWFEQINVNLNGNEPKTNEAVYNASHDPLFSVYNVDNNLRNLIFKSKAYPWMYVMNRYLNLTDGNNSVFRPGLEAYQAIRYAKQQGKQVHFAGQLFNPSVLQHLQNEKRMYLLPLIYRLMTIKSNTFWTKEFEAYFGQIDVHGLRNFAESIDDVVINWFIKMFERLAPYQKRILIDQEDERLFNLIYQKLDGKTLFAVVNHWHVPGIEAHWRHTTGTEIKQEFINPIGDFDINELEEGKLLNDTLRRLKSKSAQTEPAVTSDYLNHYNKQVLEAERERHVFFDGYNDPHLEHGLYLDENKDIKNLPYKPDEHH